MSYDVRVVQKELVGVPDGYLFLELDSERALAWADECDMPVDGGGVAIAFHLREEFDTMLKERGLTVVWPE